MATGNHIAPEKLSPNALEEERREFDSVMAALTGSSRLVRLLAYISEYYFQGETEKLNEYNIATEVFGRSKNTFNASEDAIVRVEFHRLRKRLKEYYETDGKGHPIQLLVPPGSYSPVFIQSIPKELPPISQPSDIQGHANHSDKHHRWLYLFMAVVVLLGVVLTIQYLRKHKKSNASTENISASQAPRPVGGIAYAEVPLRILAGYTGKPQIDNAGQVWQPDQYFKDGGSWHTSQDFIGNSSNPLLYEHWRNGQFSYAIPLRPGTYELHLYFAAEDRNTSSPLTFNVSVNGDVLLPNLDVYSDTMGTYIADERVFRDIHPASDGYLHLALSGTRAIANLNAIEILPGTPHRQLPVRITMQPRPVTDHSGNIWHPDDYYQGGYTQTKHLDVSGTSDSDLFGSERYGHFAYSIPVDTRGRYTVNLYFVELYFGSKNSGTGGVGSRIFRVLCNGNLLLDNFDIYKEAGDYKLVKKSFSHITPTTDGKLNITFEPIVNNATVSAIEVIDESPQ